MMTLNFRRALGKLAKPPQNEELNFHSALVSRLHFISGGRTQMQNVVWIASQVAKTAPVERFGFNRLEVSDFPPSPAVQYEPKVRRKHPIDVRDEVKS